MESTQGYIHLLKIFLTSYSIYNHIHVEDTKMQKAFLSVGNFKINSKMCSYKNLETDLG